MKKNLLTVLALFVALTFSLTAQASEKSSAFKNKDYQITFNCPKDFKLLTQSEDKGVPNTLLALFMQADKSLRKYNYIGVVVEKLDKNFDSTKIDGEKVKAKLEQDAKALHPEMSGYAFTETKISDKTFYYGLYYDSARKEDIVQAITYSGQYSYTFSMVATFNAKETLDTFGKVLESFKAKA